MSDLDADLIESMRALHRRFEEEGTLPGGGSPVDFRALYSAVVVAQRPLGGDLQGLSVVFDDARITAPQFIPYTPAVPASTLVLLKGTRVLVGWYNGSEANPYVAGAWLGDGGLASLSISSPWTAPAVGGDVVSEHDRGGGAAPTVTVLDPADVSSAVVAGRDRMMRVTFVVSNNVNAGTPLVRVRFARAYASPVVVLGKNSDDVSLSSLSGSGFDLSASANLSPGTKSASLIVGEADPP